MYAANLVKAFGADVFEIIEQSPERLREIGGIGAVCTRGSPTAERIRRSSAIS